jgi:hypothetical protein
MLYAGTHDYGVRDYQQCAGGSLLQHLFRSGMNPDRLKMWRVCGCAWKGTQIAPASLLCLLCHVLVMFIRLLVVISGLFWSVHAISSCRSSMFTMFANGKHGLASVWSWLSHCILQSILLGLRAAETILLLLNSIF